MSRTLQTALLALLVLVACAGLAYALIHKEPVPQPNAQAMIGTTTTSAMLPAATSTASAEGQSTSSPIQAMQGTQPAMNFEVVTTPAAQQQGLGDRAAIPDDYAMLFVFPTDGTYGFWMKDMLVPIDMIWLADDGTIIKIDANVSPDTYPDVYYPPAPVKYVLETKADFAQEHGWTIGTKVTLPAPY